jgi:hypothetical protein
MVRHIGISIYLHQNKLKGMTAGGAVVDLILCAGCWSRDSCRLQERWRPQWDVVVFSKKKVLSVHVYDV